MSNSSNNKIIDFAEKTSDFVEDIVGFIVCILPGLFMLAILVMAIVGFFSLMPTSVRIICGSLALFIAICFTINWFVKRNKAEEIVVESHNKVILKKVLQDFTEIVSREILNILHQGIGTPDEADYIYTPLKQRGEIVILFSPKEGIRICLQLIKEEGKEKPIKYGLTMKHCFDESKWKTHSTTSYNVADIIDTAKAIFIMEGIIAKDRANA